MNLSPEQPRPDAQPAPAREHMGLTVDSRSTGNVAVVYCKGRLDLGEGLEELVECVKAAFHAGNSVLLHLGGIEAIDAAGIGALAELAAQAAESKRELRLCSVPRQVAEVIALTHLADVLEIYPTEKDGLASYLGIAAFWRAS